MEIKEIINELEKFAELSLQESWDNCGVQVGCVQNELKGIVLCLDVTEKTILKAIETDSNLIISHHPLIFNGLKSLTGITKVEKIIIDAIKNGIVIYSAHTNFDKAPKGVSFALAQKIGLKNITPLLCEDKTLKKVIVFTPVSALEKIKEAAFSAGAGNIGAYDSCCFTSTGTGTFRALDGANPYVGNLGETHHENEVKFETIVTENKLNNVLDAIISVHPYEEVAFDVYNLDVTRKDIGLGIIGEIEPMNFNDFSAHLKKCLDIPYIRHSEKTTEIISRVALCGGSGASFTKEAIRCGANVYLSGDFKYHDFQLPNNKLTIMDIGHFESEKFIINIFYDIVTKKFSTFADRIVIECENPVFYV